MGLGWCGGGVGVGNDDGGKTKKTTTMVVVKESTGGVAGRLQDALEAIQTRLLERRNKTTHTSILKPHRTPRAAPMSLDALAVGARAQEMAVLVAIMHKDFFERVCWIDARGGGQRGEGWWGVVATGVGVGVVVLAVGVGKGGVVCDGYCEP